MREKTVNLLKKLCLPVFEEFALELRKMHPTFHINVGEGSVGGNTSYQGHNVYIECWRDDNEYDEPNCIALCVGVKSLDSQPILCDLDVCWGGDGNPPPQETLDLIEHEVPWNDNAIDEIKKGIPKLKENLIACLKSWESTYPLIT